VVLRGRKPWPPCAHIVKLSGRTEIFKYLARQSGIGAEVLVGGEIHVGDPIVFDEGDCAESA
jgi:MOSC domain-containing protein YiiM